MAKTFMEMAQEAMAEVSGISPAEVDRRLREDTRGPGAAAARQSGSC